MFLEDFPRATLADDGWTEWETEDERRFPK